MDTDLIVDREEDFSDEEAINYLLENGENVERAMRTIHIASLVHMVPSSTGLTPCCGRTMFELPAWDRATNEADRVTCWGQR